VYSILNTRILGGAGLSYLVDRYAAILTKYDVQTLFERLQKSYGNRRKATSELRLQRKTVYDWEKSANDVRMLTKRKVLEASLKVDPDRTVSFLVKKTSDDFKEILQRQIALAYRKMMSSKKKEDFQRNLSMFNQIREMHRGALLDSDIALLDHMIQRINKKAHSFGVESIVRSTRTMPPEYLAQRTSELIDVLRLNRLSKAEIKRSFDLPASYMDSIFDAYAYIEPEPAPISKATRGIGPLQSPRDLGIEETRITVNELFYEGGTLPLPSHLMGAKYK